MAAPLRWESAIVKAHFRYTAQRLGQLQAKLDSHGNITRKDIATLLQQGDVGLARAKAQKLIQEDGHGDLLGILELEVSNLLEHFTELDTHAAPTPLLTEAIASIIYAAPHVHCKELDVVRRTLVQRFGPDFARAAATNNEGHVPARVLRTVNAPLPSATLLNQFLATIARSYDVNWNPDPERHDIVNFLSEVLNEEITQEIDMDNLRKYCVYGLPDEPSWVRPRIWKLFFGILPPKHSEWSQEISKQRECYYDLVTRLLKPYESIVMSSPTEAEALDEALLNIFKHISRIPRQMFSHLETAPELFSISPLSPGADEEVKIDHAFALDERLKVLRENDDDTESEASAPTIKISVENEPTPGIKISDHDDEDSESGESSGPQTILESKAYSFGSAHPLHCSAILRLLFIHASINPGKLSPHIPALLVPLYSALLQEVEPEDLAHVEADTFWLFEAIVSEISELDEEEGGQKWMSSFDSVVAWADPELYTDLQAKGLQPALPHYSYRWLATLLTYTLPVPAIFIVWDAIFSRLPRDKDANFKLDFLVDVTSAMLIALRKQLLGLGQVTSGSLWNDEGLAPELASRELTAEGDAFLEGISMLQAYPLNSVEDAEQKRKKRAAQTAQAPGFGARLRTTMWKGFTNHIDPADESPDSGSEREKKEDGNETERPSQGLGFGLPSVLSGLRGTAPPVPPKDGSKSEPSAQPSGPSTAAAGLWNYAEKLKDSDAVANLAKMGTNWRARAVTVTGWGRGAQPTTAPVVNNGEILS
ncbi:hypothetical protein FA13DRAFT_1813970 [Coprinellus micaceus]|uniref:Rab-GAP TBC domain-containing protein n=1 Tax=Coprinellus micaceus TaxID=71717 RepID=A0A4Y7TCK5_COPMI|nr:hypothetical protein FA13DRAFT_1813970 [Coprinellus micaceus]